MKIKKEVKRRIFESKRAEIFGMSFSMIFSIILVVFFIIGAFVAIRAFLGYQKCSQVGLFLDDLKSRVNEAFNSESSSFVFTSSLPSGIEYVCFVNISEAFPNNANNIEKEIFSFMQQNEDINFKNNFYFYSPEKSYCNNLKFAKIEHVDLSLKNPICSKVIGGKVSIKIERQFDKPLVKVS